MKLKIKIPGIGFVLLFISLIFTLIGFGLYFRTFSIFHYLESRITIAGTIIALWGTVFLLINSLFSKDNPIYLNVLYLTNVFALAFAFAYFLIPCLSPIGIFFTVNMGDMETYALGVPRCIAGCVFYVLALLSNILASFFSPSFNLKHRKKGGN